MGRRIVAAILLVILVVFAVYFYRQWHAEKTLADGSVRCEGCMTQEQHDAFVKENAGETTDGQSERKSSTARNADAAAVSAPAGFPATAPTVSDQVRPNVIPAGQTTVDRGTTYPPAAASSPVNGSGSTQNNTGYSQPVGSYNQTAAPAAPAYDTLPPNPPNGRHFGGSGPYEWYRQGNLTWRIDTLNGTSCVVYATPEEWRKPIVMRHGCGSGA